jgi:glycerol-3-phosphate dehydrogenase (NAD(P)+)
MNVAVLGGGSWGTALAAHMARCEHAVRMWLRDDAVAAEIHGRDRNTKYLGDIPLPKGIQVTTVLAEALDEAEATFLVVPSEALRTVCCRLQGSLPPSSILVSATKGLETGTECRMSEIVAEELPGCRVAVLSGPSFAEEVAREQPTAVVVASTEEGVARRIQHSLASRTFRAYSSDDLIGVELAGALKNVIAIAAGIVDGLGYGHNTVAALITRGLAEITRLAVALGGRPDTLAGLAGLGDLVLTCTGALSRNRHVGHALGRGLSLAEAVAETRMVAEGVKTTEAGARLAARTGVDMPIVQQMRAVLYGGKRPREAVDDLMLRSLKRE